MGLGRVWAGSGLGGARAGTGAMLAGGGVRRAADGVRAVSWPGGCVWAWRRDRRAGVVRLTYGEAGMGGAHGRGRCGFGTGLAGASGRAGWGGVLGCAEGSCDD